MDDYEGGYDGYESNNTTDNTENSGDEVALGDSNIDDDEVALEGSNIDDNEVALEGSSIEDDEVALESSSANDEVTLEGENKGDVETDNANDKSTSRSLHDDLNNPDLFDENKQGDYTYSENDYGKTASGSLELEKGERDAVAQRNAGGKDRTDRDDGGHFIGARFNGAPGAENLEAQDRSLNRGSYKQRENDWAKSLENGDKVFVNAESYHSNGSQRPDAFMGYQVIEHEDGTREWDAFSYQNEDPEVQAAQNEEVARQNDLIYEYDNAMEYPDDYDPAEFEEGAEAQSESGTQDTNDASDDDDGTSSGGDEGSGEGEE